MPHFFTTRLFDRLITFALVLLVVYAISDNRSRIRKLENQVCGTVGRNYVTLPTIAYYRDPAHKAELDAALVESKRTLMEFHCPIPKRRAER